MPDSIAIPPTLVRPPAAARVPNAHWPRLFAQALALGLALALAQALALGLAQALAADPIFDLAVHLVHSIQSAPHFLA